MAAPQISVIDDGRRLSVTLENGRQRAVAVEMLWSECPGASARRRRIDGSNAVPTNIRVTAVTEVGYGLHIAFSADARGGVFPWPMLVELSTRPTIEDFITPLGGA